jgi:hypothetical protein
MPLPNLNNPTKVEGRNVIVSSLLTSASGILVNPSGSNETLRISSIYATNIDGSNSCDVNIYIVNSGVSPAATGYLAYTISVPADASLLPLTKDSNTYIMENQSLFASASATGDISLIINYEDIS